MKALAMLINAGADIHAPNDDGETPLLSAAKAGSPAIVLWLIKLGASASICDSTGHSPLHFASHLVEHVEGPEALKALVAAGGDIHAQNEHGKTPLFMAAQAGSPAAVFLLLESGSSPSSKTHSGDYPLHWAVYSLHTSVISTLVHAGAQIDAAGANGESPLHWAAAIGALHAAQALLELGANPDACDEHGQTPIHHAIRKLQPHQATGMVSLLLERGSDMDATDHGKQTPLHYCISLCSVSAAHKLLEYGAKVCIIFIGFKQL
ncbi:hypothetical protein BOTBODRAFT_159497 [Botryobasidium botryosum FD-172 SS1]|uniref:Uncharacterized protein n=1 Tax=Botryobasidium botryosum (strain FD-172 SS1) TaxID=930990 RepID=A0A067MES9_BOTB1|nr:hypothetical protein BOTBODRAFT_159497 [Botryobasidium botryosum FD-172 SS1]